MSSRVHKFPSFSKACEQRRYLHTIDRLLHYFSAFISMFQQRQLSNGFPLPANLRNDTCQLKQRNLSTCVAPAIDLCDATCRLKISPDDLFPSEKTLQNVDDLTRASSSDY